jgi:hypothetical protein
VDLPLSRPQPLQDAELELHDVHAGGTSLRLHPLEPVMHREPLTVDLPLLLPGHEPVMTFLAEPVLRRGVDRFGLVVEGAGGAST